MNSFSEVSEDDLRNWRQVIPLLVEVRDNYVPKLEVVVYSLVLFSEYITAVEETKLYYIACLEIASSIVDMDKTTSTDFLHTADMGDQVEQFIAIRNRIVLKQADRLHSLRKIDFLDSDARSIGLFCMLWHPYFTTLSDEQMYDSYLQASEGSNTLLSRKIISTLQQIVEVPDIAELIDDQKTLTLLSVFNTLPMIRVRLSYIPKVYTSSPHILEKYEKIRTIGSGSFGKISVVATLDGVMVVKKQDLGYDCSSALRELSILSTYKHRNIVDYYGFSLSCDSLRIGMEFGVCLCEVIYADRDGIKNWNRVFVDNERLIDIKGLDKKSISEDIVNGVRYLHSRGIVHNDIKVENIILVGEGLDRVAKLIDFGFADLFAKSRDKDQLIGTQTASFRSPEFLLRLDKKYGVFSSDIWAVGATLLAIETRVLPFKSYSNDFSLVDSTVLENIRLVLGSPKEGIFDNYKLPFLRETGLKIVDDVYARKRILKMLQYEPSNRVL